MGVRIYPNTINRVNLEKLAGVPAGTMDRLEAFQARHEAEKAGLPHAERYELEYRQWQEINADPSLGDMEAFLIYGWGKFAHVPGLSHGYAGSLDSVSQARILLQSNGINADAELTEGVHWF